MCGTCRLTTWEITYLHTSNYWLQLMLDIPHLSCILRLSMFYKEHKDDDDCRLRTSSCSYLVVNDNAFNDGLIQHLLVPVLQSLWFGNFHVDWVTVEYIVISFTRRTSPDVCHCIPAHIMMPQHENLKLIGINCRVISGSEWSGQPSVVMSWAKRRLLWIVQMRKCTFARQYRQI